MAVNLQNVKLEISAGFLSQFPKNNLPHIVFSGRSNVGKSSLINTLLGRSKLARVSSAPGKTITINFYDVDRKFYFVDMPGYGFAKRAPQDRAIWQELVNDYFLTTAQEHEKVFVLQLIDLKVGATKDDLMMLSFLNETDIDYMIVATKSDKLNATNREKQLDALLELDEIKPGTPIVSFSALKNDGKTEVWSEIYTHI